ncbi:MAG: hypothetical protein LBM93_06195, partial [Oscillospiraceae bacterium]|nr:hypothetical protein [Oscillospiraceae bacterium]
MTQRATGATGPAALDNVQNYQPGKTDYPVGTVVMYDNKPYIVTSNPQNGGTPDTDPNFSELEITSNVPGATGATGATGPAALDNVQNYQPGKTDYPVGSVVMYDNKPYIVTSNPQSGGAPDTDPKFSELEITSHVPGATGATGATGPAALDNVQNYQPGKTDYPVGTVVMYDNKPYIVTSNPQSGDTPDTDPS